MPRTVPSSPSSGPRFPMMLRYSMRRNCSAVCSPIEVSIASFMAANEGARLSAGLSTLLTKLGSASVKSISSLKRRSEIRSRMRFVLAGGMKTASRFLMKPWMISANPATDNPAMVKKIGSMLLRIRSMTPCFFASSTAVAAAVGAVVCAKPPAARKSAVASSAPSSKTRNLEYRRIEIFPSFRRLSHQVAGQHDFEHAAVVIGDRSEHLFAHLALALGRVGREKRDGVNMRLFGRIELFDLGDDRVIVIERAIGQKVQQLRLLRKRQP